MRENILHFIWKNKKFNTLQLKTTDKKLVQILNVGTHNYNSGPDFLNVLLKIDDQLWAGNIEIHIKSSFWYQHGHDKDKAYDNVILHVVWEYDSPIYRSDKSVISTLELQPFISKQVLNNYYKLFSSEQKWINCEKDFPYIDNLILNNWLERLYLERLERKCHEIEILLKSSQNDWEAVCFKMIAKNFGLYINADSFLSIANSIDYSIIRKIRSNLFGLEALLFGQSGLLEENLEVNYHKELKKEFLFLKRKFKLNNSTIVPVKFLRLRPHNFPTIRLSQLANLYYRQRSLFSMILKFNAKKDFYKILSTTVSSYWKTHYSFLRESKIDDKDLSENFIDLILINTIIPLKFSYEKSRGKRIGSELLDLINSIDSENNQISKRFFQLKKISKSALNSQSLLQLKNEYCDKNKCLQCAVGNVLLNRNM